jgi:hypothetical protein
MNEVMQMSHLDMNVERAPTDSDLEAVAGGLNFSSLVPHLGGGSIGPLPPIPPIGPIGPILPIGPGPLLPIGPVIGAISG